MRWQPLFETTSVGGNIKFDRSAGNYSDLLLQATEEWHSHCVQVNSTQLDAVAMRLRHLHSRLRPVQSERQSTSLN